MELIANGVTMRVWFMILCFLALTFCSNAQESAGSSSGVRYKEPWIYVGPYVGYNRNVFLPKFASFPNQPTCNVGYRSGAGNAFSLGLLTNVPIDEQFSIGARLGYTSLSGSLANSSIIGYTADIGSGQQRTDPITSEYSLQARLNAVAVEPLVTAVFYKKLRVSAGLRAAFLFSSTFDEREQLLSPGYVFFLPDSSRVRLQRSGDIPNVNPMQLAASFGIGLDIPLQNRWIITPELNYHQSLNKLSDVDWSVSTIQFGAALRIPLFKSPPPVLIRDTVYKRDTLVTASIQVVSERVTQVSSTVESNEDRKTVDDVVYINERYTVVEKYTKVVPKVPQLSVNVQAFGVMAGGQSSSVSGFVVEETEIEENYSLLPHIFFPEGESKVERTRMSLIDKSRVGGFSESRLPKNTLEVYHELLNIVGSRMSASTAVTVTLVGCNSNTGSERGNTELSRARAESVRAYLNSVWGIDPARVSIKAQNLPGSPSNVANEEGQAENRRVEIIPSDAALLSAVSIKNATVRSTPQIVEVVPEVTSEAGVASWSAVVAQEGKELRRISGTDAPQPYAWNVTDEPYPKMEKPVTVTYEVTDRSGQRVSSSHSLEASQLSIRRKRFEQTDDRRIERFSLIVFDFNKAELSPENKQILVEVQSRIQPNSVVTIAGYADRSGDAEYNRELARRRCMEVQKVISAAAGNTMISPIGSAVLLYDNETPEGRAYSRTVQIIIETPTQ